MKSDFFVEHIVIVFLRINAHHVWQQCAIGCQKSGGRGGRRGRGGHKTMAEAGAGGGRSVGDEADGLGVRDCLRPIGNGV